MIRGIVALPVGMTGGAIGLATFALYPYPWFRLPERPFELPARRDTLRIFDSSFRIFDSELGISVTRHAVCAGHVIPTCLDVPATSLKLRIFDSELWENDS